MKGCRDPLVDHPLGVYIDALEKQLSKTEDVFVCMQGRAHRSTLYTWLSMSEESLGDRSSDSPGTQCVSEKEGSL